MTVNLFLLQFMIEFCSSWHWTLTEGIGMFSCSSKKLKPSDVQPHVVLIDVSF